MTLAIASLARCTGPKASVVACAAAAASAALRGEPLGVGASPRSVVTPRGGAVPWRTVCSASEVSAGAVSLPKKGCCLGFRFRRWTLSPPPCPGPKVGSGCGVAARSVASQSPSGFLPKKGTVVTSGPPPVVAARLPSGSPPRWRTFRPLAGVRGCRPAAVGVPSEEGRLRDCWLAAWSVRRRSSSFRCLPPRGWLAGPGTLFRGPPPSEEGVAARTRLPPVAEAPVGLPSRRCQPPRRSVLPERRFTFRPLSFRRSGTLSTWCVAGVARLPKKVGYASGGRSLSLCSLPAEPKPVGLVAFPRLRGKPLWLSCPAALVLPRSRGSVSGPPLLGASAGSCAWDRSAPAEAGSVWPAASFFPGPERPWRRVAAPPRPKPEW